MMPMPYYGGGMGIATSSPADLALISTLVVLVIHAGKEKAFPLEMWIVSSRPIPQFEKEIRDMYLPGVQGTPFFKQAGIPSTFDAKYVS
jgi:hypothetical protein